jgi:hypothetical protein
MTSYFLVSIYYADEHSEVEGVGSKTWWFCADLVYKLFLINSFRAVECHYVISIFFAGIRFHFLAVLAYLIRMFFFC